MFIIFYVFLQKGVVSTDEVFLSDIKSYCDKNTRTEIQAKANIVLLVRKLQLHMTSLNSKINDEFRWFVLVCIIVLIKI